MICVESVSTCVDCVYCLGWLVGALALLAISLLFDLVPTLIDGVGCVLCNTCMS